MTTATLTMPLIDALNRRNLDDWSALTTADCRSDYPSAPGMDKAAARAYNETYLRAFADLQFTVRQSAFDGNTQIVLWEATGTHNGPLATPQGTIAPTGRTGKVRGVLIAEWRDGKVCREESYWNQIELMRQLGLA
jgi:hypothetical protein